MKSIVIFCLLTLSAALGASENSKDLVTDLPSGTRVQINGQFKINTSGIVYLIFQNGKLMDPALVDYNKTFCDIEFKSTGNTSINQFNLTVSAKNTAEIQSTNYFYVGVVLAETRRAMKLIGVSKINERYFDYPIVSDLYNCFGRNRVFIQKP